MGSQQSAQTMPQHPVIQKLTQTLNLLSQKPSQPFTYSLAHRHFANQFSRIEKTKFDRSMNPFCPVSSKDNGEKWGTCGLVSPLMAIAEVGGLVGKGGGLAEDWGVLPVYKRMEVSVEVDDVIVIEGNLGLLVFAEPYWRVGWAGLSYITTQEQLYKLDLKSVSHPQRTLLKQQQKQVHIQEVRRLKLPKTASLSPTSTLQSTGPKGSLICKLVDKKPYIIGVQLTENEIKFIDEGLFKAIQEKCRGEVRKRGQRDILKAMDVHQLEIQTEL